MRSMSVQACSADNELFQLVPRINGSSVTWTVVGLAATKFKPVIFRMLGFTLSYIANRSKSQFLATSY
jgi:hypothetical protein